MEPDDYNKVFRNGRAIHKGARELAGMDRGYRRQQLILAFVGLAAVIICAVAITFAVGQSSEAQTNNVSDASANMSIVSAITSQEGVTAEASSTQEPQSPQQGDLGTTASNDSVEIQKAKTDDEDDADPRLKESKSKNTKKPKGKVIYLTFDDGPSKFTPSILKTLKNNDVKATWFVTGNCSNIEYVKKIWKAGHQIALHSDTHNYKKIYKSTKAFFKDMNKVAKKIENRIGISPKLLRFPGGSINSYDKRTYKSIIKQIHAKGWHYFDWNAAVNDAVSPTMRSKSSIIAAAKSTSRGKKAVCMLMHDTNAKRSTAEGLDSIIKYFKKKGYRFEYLTADSYGFHF